MIYHTTKMYTVDDKCIEINSNKEEGIQLLIKMLDEGKYVTLANMMLDESEIDDIIKMLRTHTEGI